MPEKEVEFWDYIVLLLKYKYLVATVMVVFLGIGFIFYKLEIPYYSSSAKLIIDTESYQTKYNIKSAQDPNILAEQARSYEVVLQSVVDLDLLNHEIKPELKEVVIKRIKSKIPFFNTDTRDKMNIREIVQYYQRHVNVKTSGRGKVISVSVNAQDSKIAPKVANRIGEILIERNLEEKNSKIKKTLAYIENQIDSVTQLLQRNRASKEDYERSANYLEVARLDDQIVDLETTLQLLVKEKEHLNTMDILTYDFYSGLSSINDSEYNEKKAEVDRKKEEITLQKTYIEARIVEVRRDLESFKEQLRNTNKSEYYKAQDMEFAIGTDEKILTNLLGEKQSIELADLIASKDIKFMSRAYEPILPNRTKGLIYLLVFFLVGGAVSFSSVIVINFFDKRFRTTDEIEEITGLDILGIIPRISKQEEAKMLSPKEHPSSIALEAYRTLRTNMNFEKKDNKTKTIAVTSAKPSEGKTTTIMNLASIMADSGDKVLVLDVDLRNPAIHRQTHIQRKPGFTELMSGKAKISQVMKKIKDNLYAIPVGSLMYNPQSMIESKQMDKFLADMSKKFDYVLCDTIPVLAMSDAEILSSKTDATVLVMDNKKALKKEMLQAKERLLKINADIMGIVINKNKKRSSKYKFYYGK